MDSWSWDLSAMEILARAVRVERCDLWQRRGVPPIPRTEGLTMRMVWKMLSKLHSGGEE